MGKCTERLYNGIVKENPTFVLMLGMCPTLAVTTSAINGAGMGLATTCILVMSNMVISMLRKVIPDKVRIPAYIVIIASFVTIIQFLMEAYFPSLNSSLGLYIPLIVVNCIILGRAESYASKNKVFPSIFDGLGMGLGFTIGLTVIGIFRELIGNGSIFNYQILGEGNLWQEMSGAGKTVGDILGHYTPVAIFVRAPGAFLVLAFLVAFINKRNAVKAAKAGGSVATCRQESCATCTNTMCGGKIFTEPVVAEPEVQKEPEEEKPKVVIPEKIERKPVEETAQESEKKQSEIEPDSEQKASEESSETKEHSTEGQSEKSGSAEAESVVDEQAATDEQSTTEEQSAEENAEEKKEIEETDSEAKEEKHVQDTDAEEVAEEKSVDTVTESNAEKQVAEAQTVTEDQKDDIETEPSADDQAKVVQVEPEKQGKESETETAQEGMHESDAVSTSKLTRPDITDPSSVDQYEELIDEDANQKKRRRKKKRGRGGKR